MSLEISKLVFDTIADMLTTTRPYYNFSESEELTRWLR